MQQQEKKWYQSANFWTAVVLAVGGLFIGFPENEARGFVEGLFGLIAVAGLIREKLKGATIDAKAWIARPNTWNYIATAIIAIVPSIPVELFQRLRDLADSAISGNWQGIVTALFSIGTIIFYLVKGGGK